MIIAKIVKPFLRNPAYQPYNDFLWVSTVTKPVGYTTPAEYITLGYTFDEYPSSNIGIGQVYIDNVEYTETISIASCTSIEKSWYFDSGAQKLYIHPNHLKRLTGVVFSNLETRGYSNGTSRFGGVWYDDNDLSYKPLMKGTVSISDKVDRGIFGKMSFVSNNITFENRYDKLTGEGEFNYVFDTPVPGATVKILYISDSDIEEGKKTLTPIYEGFVESEEITASEYRINVADKREQLNGKIPNIYFDAVTYPLAKDKVIGSIIPEGYGDLLGCPATCINGTVTSGDVLYKYATDGTTVTTVYVKIDGEWVEKTPTASSGTDCTFTLSSSDGRASSGAALEAKVDCRLRDIDNPAEIIADMVTRYLSIPFNSDYYDFGTWSQEAALLGDVGLYLGKRDEFFKWVELLQNGSTSPFIFRINPDGKYENKVDDITRAVKRNFSYIENISDERSVETDFTNYATDVLINYNYDQKDKTYQSETLDTFKQETLDTYRYPKELEFETLLTEEADAITRGTNNLKEFKLARPLHSVSFRGIIKCDLLDVITYESRIKFGDINRVYAGTKKLKIASYKYDFDNDLTYFTGYDISDIISKGTSVYTQGYMYDDAGYGEDFYYSPTTIYEPEAG